MRAAPLVSESAQWHTISWTDQRPDAGRQRTAASGTRARASRSRSGPRSYWSMRSSISAALKGMALLRSGEPTPLSGPPPSRDGLAQGGHDLTHRDGLAQDATHPQGRALRVVEDQVPAQDHRRHRHALGAQRLQETPPGQAGHLLVDEDRV